MEDLGPYIETWEHKDEIWSVAYDYVRSACNGGLYYLPGAMGSDALYYRKDWFERDGVVPPTNWDELLEVAKHFTDPANNRYGLAIRGGPGGNTYTFYFMIAALGKPMAVVLVGGSVIEMPWLKDVPSVVMSWYSGIHGGRALGDLLLGHRNFSGKLPLTWPNHWRELPVFDPGVPSDVEMDYFFGYRYYDKNGITPLFPFGHGLSYTSFAYNNLEVPCSTVTKRGVVDIKIDVVNEGDLPGEEVVFLFVAFPETKARRSVKELKGFQRVSLEPGQAKQVTIPLKIASLKYWSIDKNDWIVESGKVEIMLSSSSANIASADHIIVE